MDLEKLFGKFYSPLHIISSGKPLLISIGSRSIGKTTGWAIYIINEWLKHGREFIYTRRTRDELMRTCKGYFKTAIEILNEHGADITNFRYWQGNYYITVGDGKEELCGYALALSEQSKFKSGIYGNVWWIIYDEFVATDKSKYLGREENIEYEYDQLIMLYQTVDRTRGKAARNECRIICMGNNIKAYQSSVMIGCGASDLITDEAKFINPKDAGWCLELTSEVEATRDIKKSWAYWLTREEERKMNYDNLADDKSEFIGRRTGVFKPLCNMQYKDHKMGVYAELRQGFIYVCNATNDRETIAMTTQDQNHINRLMADSMKGVAYFETIKKYVLNGKCYYQDRKCRNEILRYFRMI